MFPGRQLLAGLPLLLIVALGFAGCGGGGGGTSAAGSYTYIEEPLSHGAPSGIYTTLISPVPIPRSFLTRKNTRLVTQAKGHLDCSATKIVRGGRGPSAFLNGKAVTVKINGANPEMSLLCSVLKKGTFDASHLGGR
jgi:hypothetical protein